MALCALPTTGHPPSLQSYAQQQQRYEKTTVISTLGKTRAGERMHVRFGTDFFLKRKNRNIRRQGATPPQSNGIPAFRRSGQDGGGRGAAAGQRFEEPFREAIFELEIMVRDPAEVLGGMQERLSAKDLELVITYFAQEGRDSWCALEVYEWMQKENLVGDDTQKLMMSIMYDWVMKLVEGEQPVEEVKSLLQDMHCVGLKPEFHIIQSIIATYWEKGRKEEALCFVKQLLEIGVDNDREDPVAFLVLKMVRGGEQKEGVELVRMLRGCGFRLCMSAYSTALLAAVKEQEQLSQVQRQVKTLIRSRAIQELEKHELKDFSMYEERLHQEAEEIARWAEEEAPDKMAGIHERLLAMYCIAGKGLDAERALWQMKLSGREPPMEMYNTIIGICGFGNHREAASRILQRMEDIGPKPVKKTFTVLIGGFLKGGNFQEASETLQQMMKHGYHPEPHVMLAVLGSLKKSHLVNQYLHLSRTLAQAGLIEPCLLYFYMDALNLCIIRPL